MSSEPLNEVKSIVQDMKTNQTRNPVNLVDANKFPIMSKQTSRKASNAGHHPNQKIITLSIKRNEVQLQQAEDGKKFVFDHKGKGGKNASKKPERSLQQNIRADLNKLCPENYTSIVKNIKSYKIPNKVDEFKNIINMIFEKALDDEYFSAVYGDLCSDLSDHNKELRQKDEDALKRQNKDAKTEIPNFRDTLLRCCQDLFEKFSFDTQGDIDGTSKFMGYVSKDEKNCQKQGGSRKG